MAASGFASEHFELLQTWKGTERNKADPAQNEGYEKLVEAYDATAAWARAVRAILFPRGIVKKLSKPTNQAHRFKPYTWVRIYPRPEAPEELAYTVGIDASGWFCVKIDTVFQSETIRARYDRITGGNYLASPVAANLSQRDGLRLTREELVSWSVEEIGRFEIGYDTVARELGLLDGPMRPVTDTQVCRDHFARWANVMTETAVQRGAVLALTDHLVFMRRSDSSGKVEMKFGQDPRGVKWAVEINEPTKPGDYNALSAIAEDETGGRYLLRQGRLHGGPNAATIQESEFAARTGLSHIEVEATGNAAARRWFLVANLDDPPEAVIRDTARFVDFCWSARMPGRATPMPQSSVGETLARPETGGFYTVGPKTASEARQIKRLQGEVWIALAEKLSAQNIPYEKRRQQGGYEIDMKIDRRDQDALLLEIKSGSGAADLHTGIGQLHLYRQLFSNFKGHVRFYC
ncbi:hypothetical protein [Mesorhizobium sp. WSM3860]|uniref:hypothetical protein n=1 Tax=Mesorhizobium sp. WSM3860 TaxID=2029403 RepID=UPI000BAF58CF|nr:hypothetical protein [Mesorhizobium sp. WSM3860]PBC04277.1 hypothetical protein CK220_11725 [Mesorhizobium sp. WSM3860]